MICLLDLLNVHITISGPPSFHRWEPLPSRTPYTKQTSKNSFHLIRTVVFCQHNRNLSWYAMIVKKAFVIQFFYVYGFFPIFCYSDSECRLAKCEIERGFCWLNLKFSPIAIVVVVVSVDVVTVAVVPWFLRCCCCWTGYIKKVLLQFELLFFVRQLILLLAFL